MVTLGATAALLAEAPASAAPPAGLKNLGDARQVIVVTGRSWTSTYSTVTAFQRTDQGRWIQTFAAMPARNGYGGWAWSASRVQDTGTTPAGTFTITQAFGVLADPGTRLSYRKVDGNDYWVGDQLDPRTYNLLQPSASAKRTWRTSEAERLAAYPTQYAHAAVIDFNRPAGVHWNEELGEFVADTPAHTSRGSAIFLHASGKGSTAGCVSVSRADVAALLRWLDPALRPRIVMAPASDLANA
ncbi:hypothetical protein Asi03nite_58750 [Actinoplanes siamensis]|uniref:L,D-TPase catalytic domain-containing protein n=1 Tax=Actinoplanes siamensis TaxID=1223317 RepID=A0A919NBW6_9ACTN|nr:hypothetical protein Asi03nite_58750 [Actinoplanes siamensis]